MFRLAEKITEIIGWIGIAISPTLLGAGIGFIVYYNFPTIIGQGIGIFIAVTGLISGCVLATNKYKTTGTVAFLSRISATPELDKTEEAEQH